MAIPVFLISVVLTLVFRPPGNLAQSCEDFAGALVNIERQNMNRRCPIRDRNVFFATGLGDNTEAIDWKEVQAHYVRYCVKGVNPAIRAEQLEHDLDVRSEALKGKPDCVPATPSVAAPPPKGICAESQAELKQLDAGWRESRYLGITRSAILAEDTEKEWLEISERPWLPDSYLDGWSTEALNRELGRHVREIEQLKKMKIEPPELKEVQLTAQRLWLDYWTAVLSSYETGQNLTRNVRRNNVETAARIHNEMERKREDLEKVRARRDHLRAFVSSDACSGEVGKGSPTVSGQDESPAQSGMAGAVSQLTGTWWLWQDNQMRVGPPITSIKLTIRGTILTVAGDGFSGQGTFDGKTGYYDWQFGDGRAGRTTLSLDAEGVLHGQVRGSGIAWDFQALKPQ